MKITYAICVCNEARELNALLHCLRRVIEEGDDINVLVDTGKVTQDVRDVLKDHASHIIVSQREFCGNFSAHRNYHTDQCSGDYIFVLDADELPQEYLIQNIKPVVYETRADLIYVPRMNLCPGYTKAWIEKCKFNVNEVGFINWPDSQGRVFKNNGIIKWSSELHEKLVGALTPMALPPKVEFGIWHIKSLEKQDYQDAFYKAGNKLKDITSPSVKG